LSPFSSVLPSQPMYRCRSITIRWRDARRGPGNGELSRSVDAPARYPLSLAGPCMYSHIAACTLIIANMTGEQVPDVPEAVSAARDAYIAGRDVHIHLGTADVTAPRVAERRRPAGAVLVSAA